MVRRERVYTKIPTNEFHDASHQIKKQVYRLSSSHLKPVDRVQQIGGRQPVGITCSLNPPRTNSVRSRTAIKLSATATIGHGDMNVRSICSSTAANVSDLLSDFRHLHEALYSV